jgi:hypothetical protein
MMKHFRVPVKNELKVIIPELMRTAKGSQAAAVAVRLQPASIM